PNAPITREDMMVIIYRVIKDTIAEMRNDTQVVPYEDFADVSAYAKEAVSALIAEGIINGRNGLIVPKGYVTYKETEIVISRLLAK
ncbi:MAG: S-layer homology domain-containing protein, partial [Oscillospiraceae bacterium]|nr:S-layer homology domain-containing protein [Oscillospiraceae bacterium]